MGLPSNIKFPPSGRDQSESQHDSTTSKRPVTSTSKSSSPSDKATKPPVAEKRATTTSKTKTVRQKKEPIVRGDQPVLDENGNPKKDDRGFELRRDRDTGVVYSYIPKVDLDEDGKPILIVHDMDIDDLSGEADRFLAHLRIPPNKEEMQRLRDERRRRAMESTREYLKNNKDSMEDDDLL